MHDIKAIRENPKAYDRHWSGKGRSGAADEAVRLDAELRAAQTTLQEAQAKRNESSKLIGMAKAKKDEAEAARLMAEVESLKGVMATAAEAENLAGGQLKDLLASLPNIPAPEVPAGEDEHGNLEQRRWGDATKLPAGKLNKPKDHVDLGAALGGMDFEAAARMSGARFVVLKKDIARLERAIGQFMLDLQTVEHGYTEISPPLLVRDEAMFGTGQLPKFENDLFFASSIIDLGADEELPDSEGLLVRSKRLQADEENNLTFVHREDIAAIERRRWLIPTAEVSLTNIVREQLIAEEELPMRLTALTPSFRAEAGSAGRDTRGMIRQHQFYKVELVSITSPDQSEAEHQRMVECAETVLKKLELPFRTMLLCTGDMGFGAKKTYDLEVWLPSQDMYREISSCSNCGDFQARRMDARYRKTGEKGGHFVHTLNGSGLAVGRTLVAVLENYQDEGGRIHIPAALQPYMGGVTHIGGQA
ncbi:serine--tRNA ligase [Caulobacter vibrioides]|uniref:serine--tRNA ligase n=1 Tax=Caulobacter vibrioides TaxID=155892 RepID=UPI000BB478BC|nr:serine--tRNA ligase [Caulobacter vibrioides]ATC24961.1 serine--tRNA ligase [Caulobacter vibrioides]AZH13115.1 serine--tRNA ligase [Caulobacter vibrioides]PLR09741.1 serine--tRNA ligase [Caulobacter vibrioides]